MKVLILCGQYQAVKCPFLLVFKKLGPEREPYCLVKYRSEHNHPVVAGRILYENKEITLKESLEVNLKKGNEVREREENEQKQKQEKDREQEQLDQAGQELLPQGNVTMAEMEGQLLQEQDYIHDQPMEVDHNKDALFPSNLN